jgi:quinol monooxygenase YgiN
MGKIVIVCYVPFAGNEDRLEALVRDHLDVLRQENLVTERKPVIARAKNNSIVEIFEWKSREAINAAHQNANVLKLWEQFNAVCTYGIPADMEEFNQLFSEFEAVN